MKFGGFQYFATQLGYSYGLFREKRPPKRNNVEEHGVACKHVFKAFEYILSHEDALVEAFARYYKRQGEGKYSVQHVTRPIKEYNEQPEMEPSEDLFEEDEIAAESEDGKTITFQPVKVWDVGYDEEEDENIVKESIKSSEVPEVKVGDVALQSFVSKINVVLRGVDERYFPRIVFERVVVRGNERLVFYVVEGWGFKLGLILGNKGEKNKFMVVANNGEQKGPIEIRFLENLREYMDELGVYLYKRRR